MKEKETGRRCYLPARQLLRLIALAAFQARGCVLTAVADNLLS